MKLIGIDGCKAGCVASSNDDFSNLRFEVVPDLGNVFDQARRDQAYVIIDIPIGLDDRNPRECDIEARKILSRRHKSSVFPAPARACLAACNREDYSRACELSLNASGKALSKQAHAIVKKKFEKLMIQSMPIFRYELFARHIPK
jgi:predicted RNase H-like nuclease